MSTTNALSNSPLAHLIDSRLDAIDRALLGLVPRHDRLSIVAQVETQIRELAAAGSAVETSLKDTMARAALDAVGSGEAADGALPPVLQAVASSGARTILPRRVSRSRLAVSSGVLGIVAMALLVMSPILYAVVSMFPADESILVPLVGTHVALVALGGFLAVVLGIAALVLIGRRDGRLVGSGWAITGLCTGPLPMLLGGLVALLVAAQFSDAVSVTTVYTASAAPPVPAMNPYCAPDSPVPQGYPVPGSYSPDSQPPSIAPPVTGFVAPSPAPVPMDGPTPSIGAEGYPIGNVPQESTPSVPSASPSAQAIPEPAAIP